MDSRRLSPPTFPMRAFAFQGGGWCTREVGERQAFARDIPRALLEKLENPSVGKGAAARLPTARDEELGCLLGGAGSWRPRTFTIRR